VLALGVVAHAIEDGYTVVAKEAEGRRASWLIGIGGQDVDSAIRLLFDTAGAVAVYNLDTRPASAPEAASNAFVTILNGALRGVVKVGITVLRVGVPLFVGHATDLPMTMPSNCQPIHSV
jgi:hypothetical protein